MITRQIFVSAFCLLMLCAKPCFADDIWGAASFDNGNILDEPNNQVLSTITITEAGIIEDITVTIEGIEHTNVGDLIAELRFIGTMTAEPAYLFFRPNVDGADIIGSRSNFGDGLGGRGTYSFGSSGADLWQESAIGDSEDVPQQQYFTSDENGEFHDLGGPQFFEGFNTLGQWQLVITDDNSFGNNVGFVESWSIDFDVVAVIPEPATSTLFGIAIAMIAIRRRR